MEPGQLRPWMVGYAICHPYFWRPRGSAYSPVPAHVICPSKYTPEISLSKLFRTGRRLLRVIHHLSLISPARITRHADTCSWLLSKVVKRKVNGDCCFDTGCQGPPGAQVTVGDTEAALSLSVNGTSPAVLTGRSRALLPAICACSIITG
ncbi:hypothetical protein MHYP_G00021760 [Metynnis hypsauchen]